MRIVNLAIGFLLMANSWAYASDLSLTKNEAGQKCRPSLHKGQSLICSSKEKEVWLFVFPSTENKNPGMYDIKMANRHKTDPSLIVCPDYLELKKMVSDSNFTITDNPNSFVNYGVAFDYNSETKTAIFRNTNSQNPKQIELLCETN